MAVGISMARMDRLFNIPREFWSIHSFRVAKVLPKSEFNKRWGYYENIVDNEYIGNAHPHQEYLADLKQARQLIAEQLKKIEENNIISKLDEAIEETRKLAIAEIMEDV
jgi:hypothetical protein